MTPSPMIYPTGILCTKLQYLLLKNENTLKLQQTFHLPYHSRGPLWSGRLLTTILETCTQTETQHDLHHWHILHTTPVDMATHVYVRHTRVRKTDK